MRRRHYNNGEAEFILEPVNDSVVKVTHRNQVGWIGISLDWDPQQPYTYTTISNRLKDDGIERIGLQFVIPDDVLKSLARWLLRQQRREDSQSINFEERKNAARRVLREFLAELPD